MAVVAFVLFLVWELTEEHPVVDLSLFRRRNFCDRHRWRCRSPTALFFGNVVLLPLWLQQYMGYTATWAGIVLVPSASLAMVLTPFVGRYGDKVDPRILVTVRGVLMLSCAISTPPPSARC